MKWRSMLAAALALGLASCADEPGIGWGALDLTLRARWQVPEDRRADDDAVALAGGWLVEIDDVALTVAAVRLQTGGADGAGAAGDFDPANPPPGYSLCHGGHCHADDGRLVSYEEIAAAMAGSAAGDRSNLARFAGRRLDALGAGGRAACSEGCLLTAAVPSHLVLELASLQIKGRVRDTRALPRLAGSPAFSVNIPLTGLHLEQPLAWPSRPDGTAPTWHIAASLTLGPELLDAVDWAAAAGEPLAPDDEDLEDLAVAAAQMKWTAEVRRD